MTTLLLLFFIQDINSILEQFKCIYVCETLSQKLKPRLLVPTPHKYLHL